LHYQSWITGTAIPGGAAGITASSGKCILEFVKGTAAQVLRLRGLAQLSSTLPPSETLSILILPTIAEY